MVAPYPSSPVVLSALWVPLRSTESARAFLDGVSALAQGRGRVEMSVAMLLAWLRRRDAVELGGVTWTAFCGQHVDWGSAWIRALIRLAKSPLEKVKQAVANGLVPLRRAAAAPGTVAVDQQDAWLAESVLGRARTADAPEVETFSGKDAAIIRQARHLGRLLLGWAAPAREVDAYIVRCWRDRVPSERLLADARTPPPPPSPPEAPLAWADRVDPQGEPQTVAEARARLEQAQSTLRGMTTVLARAWERVTSESLYEEAGFATGAEAAEEILGMSHRSAQRLSKLGRGLEWYPEIDAAIQAGLAPRSAAALLEVLGDHDAAAWLALAARVGRRELHRAVAAAGEERASARTLERYRKAMDIADRWAATPEGAAVLARPFGSPAAGAAAVPADVRGGGAVPSVQAGVPACAPKTTDRAHETTDRAHETTDRAHEATDRAHEATDAGGPRRRGVGPGGDARVEEAVAQETRNAGGPRLGAGVGPEGEAQVEEAAAQEPTTAGGPRPERGHLGVALAHPEPVKFSGTSLRAPPELLAAASWLLDTVILPRARGFARVKEQSGGRCTNPECGRRSLRTEAHHLIPRSLGGPDDEWNGTGACRACHIRGLHAGRLAAVRVIAEGHDAVLWSWPDGRRVLRFRDEPGEGARGP